MIHGEADPQSENDRVRAVLPVRSTSKNMSMFSKLAQTLKRGASLLDPHTERSHFGAAKPLGAIDAFLANGPSDDERATLFSAIIERLVVPYHETVFWGDRMLTVDKAAGFLSEDAFRDAYLAIRGSHIYDAYDTPNTIAWRLHTLVWAARCGLAHKGDLVECGVFKGDMAWVVSTLLADDLHGRTYYLYDSFEGFSTKLSRAEDYPTNPGFFEFANKVYSEPGLFEAVTKRFAAHPNVRIVRGFLPDSLSIAAPDQIAFLHVDLNSPAAEIKVLETLFDRVVPGGVIVFDDYGWQVFHRQREAEDRFMTSRGHTILELPTGQGLVVKH